MNFFNNYSRKNSKSGESTPQIPGGAGGQDYSFNEEEKLLIGDLPQPMAPIGRKDFSFNPIVEMQAMQSQFKKAPSRLESFVTQKSND